MYKKPRVLLVIAAVICAICLLAVLVCLVLQHSLSTLWLTSGIDVFIFPAAPVVYTLCVFGVLLLLCLVNSRGCWLEILGTLLLALLPYMQSGISTMQTIVVGRAKGAAYLAAYSAVNQLCSIPAGGVHLAVVLALLACGMRIAYKKMQKKNLCA